MYWDYCAVVSIFIVPYMSVKPRFDLKVFHPQTCFKVDGAEPCLKSKTRHLIWIIVD